MDTFADRIIAFSKGLDFQGTLPVGIHMMNPYKENVEALACSTAFYRKYYNDDHQRYLILGINPGRFGSGATGVSFTDPKRLVAACGIPFSGPVTHEPSSEFIYNMIDAYGGVKEFYHRFYIHSICPLGFTIQGKNGKEINYNYYDRPDLLKAVYPFIIENLEKQLAMGFQRDICFCLGTGKNEHFLRKLNQEMKFFNKIVALEHPRYIMQYKSKEKLLYLDKYVEAFKQVS